MNVTTDLQRGFQFQQDGLREKYFPRLQAQSSDFIFCQLDIFARSRTANCQLKRIKIIHKSSKDKMSFLKVPEKKKNNKEINSDSEKFLCLFSFSNDVSTKFGEIQRQSRLTFYRAEIFPSQQEQLFTF